jgi:hypothetical protein
MTVEGIVRNGVVVLEKDARLPEGTRVAVAVLQEDPGGEAGSLASLLAFAGKVKDLPEDMARNHDHYLHGASKR